MFIFCIVCACRACNKGNLLTYLITNRLLSAGPWWGVIYGLLMALCCVIFMIRVAAGCVDLQRAKLFKDAFYLADNVRSDSLF